MAILYFALLAIACPEPSVLLGETAQASKANAARSVNWLAQEDIRRYDPARRRKLLRWETYEASKVEGENYYRLIARDGKPLKKAEALREGSKLEREAEYRRATSIDKREPRSASARYSMSIRQLIDHHELKCSGEDATPEGRKYWIVDGRLPREAPPGGGRGDLALTGDATLWIDQETRLVLRQELRVTRAGGWNPGTHLIYEMFWNGEVMLVRRIQTRFAGATRRETEQIYSGYRKFGSTADIKFEAH